MQVYFIRHGVTKGNQEHRYVGRTDEGMLESQWEELKETGRTLGQMEHVFTSPYLRCMQSAKALFGLEEQELEVVEDFRELNFGAFEYKNYQELNKEADYQRFIDSGGTIAFPGGEEPKAFKERCRLAYAACMEKAHQHKWKKIAFVVHGGTIMAILEAYGLPKRDYFDYQVKNGDGFQGEIEQKLYISYQGLQIY